MAQADTWSSTSDGGGFSIEVALHTMDDVGAFAISSASWTERAIITVPLSHSRCCSTVLALRPYGSARVLTGLW